MVNDEQFTLLRLHLQKALVGALVNLGDGLALHRLNIKSASEGYLLSIFRSSFHNQLIIYNVQKILTLG